MKTSKRLLSFILSLAMLASTTLSGFTVSAEETLGTEEDSSFNIANTATDALESFGRSDYTPMHSPPADKYDVTIMHISTDEKVLDSEIIKNVKKGTLINGNSYKKDITGYTCTSAEKQRINSNGVVINVIYAPQDYRLKIYDDYGRGPVPRANNKVAFGTTLNYSPKAQKGYSFTHTNPEAIPATMPANDLTITFYYTRSEYTLTVINKYEGEDDVVLTVPKSCGDSLVGITPTMAEGFTYDGATTVLKKMPADDHTITFNHTRNKYDVTVNFVDENGEEIKSSVNIGSYPFEETVGIGELDTAIEGYALTNPDASVTVTTNSEANVITLIYSINSYNVTLTHIYDGEKPKTTTYEVAYNGAYSYNKIDKYGFAYSHVVFEGEQVQELYRLSTAQLDKRETISGNMPASNLKITFYYTRNNYPVRVEFVDEDGSALKSPVVIGTFPFEKTVSLTDAITPVDIAVSGYTLTNQTANVKVTDATINVIKLIYSENPVIPSPTPTPAPPIVIPNYPPLPVTPVTPAEPDDNGDIDINDPEVPTTGTEKPVEIPESEIPNTAAGSSITFAIMLAVTSAAAVFKTNKNKK